ncbi:polysaccharide biosynthesis tyrosine autokinase [Anabaena sp. UHCC 0399]|uniref:GumC family protein n=1 Tax=Anabaena sp. UHCC 0399 TaxID=3110238 RepID=UPI002B1F74A6|nr:polysaccharide biosynthesis tyrosine autokinase [Anabaena sp. UHCC 0399]MEA5566102.1 polysaccharide biosynthesis tyrosine autokinase [Anabaena sp. UHCC 0399]
MENYPYPPSSSNGSNPYSPSLSQASPISFTEEEEDNWNFQEILSIVRRRALLIAGVTITVMATVIVNLKLNPKPPQYEGSFHLLVEPVNDDAKTVDILKESNPNQAGLDYDSQIQVLKSPEILRSTIQQLQIIYPSINYGSLMNSLSINRLGETKIIEIRYRSADPNEIKVVLDLISKDYLDYSQERRQTKLKQGAKFVEKQLRSIKNRVNQIQNELQLFRQKYDFNNPESEAEEVSQQIKNLSNQRQNIDMQLALNRASFANIQTNEGKSAALNDAVLYQQLLTQVRQLDIQIASESTRLQNENPSIKSLKEKQASLLLVLQQEADRILSVKIAVLRTQIKTLELQNKEIFKAEDKWELRRRKLPILSKQYTEIQRELQIAIDSLNRLLSTRENIEIQISQSELVWQLLQAPTKPENPVSTSNTTRNLVGGLLASVFVGLGVALLMEKLDKTYHTVDRLKDKVKIPLLGNIPFEKQVQINSARTLTPNISVKGPLTNLADDISGLAIVADQNYSNYSKKFLEALRVLCTNIQLLSSERQIRSITISSAMPGDGKSTIAFHLAQIATAMGQRVLLVDADLRQPVIHTLSGLNNAWGLSNLISTNFPVEEVIRQQPSMSQLSVITGGPLPPDPARLLSSERMKQLMANFHNTFDLVIYDVPPLMGLADVNLIAPHTDGILMVVKIDKTDSTVLQKALDSLKISRLNVLGIVGNGQNHDFTVY